MCLCNSKHLVTAGKDYINNGGTQEPAASEAMEDTKQEGAWGHPIVGSKGPGLPLAWASAAEWNDWWSLLQSQGQCPLEISKEELWEGQQQEWRYRGQTGQKGRRRGRGQGGRVFVIWWHGRGLNKSSAPH